MLLDKSFRNVFDITTAITSPLAQHSSIAYTSVKTRHFLGCISSTLPTAFNGISCGVGFIKSICKDPVTKRGGATFSDGSSPFFRYNANEAEPVPCQSIKDASNPPYTNPGIAVCSLRGELIVIVSSQY